MAYTKLISTELDDDDMLDMPWVCPGDRLRFPPSMCIALETPLLRKLAEADPDFARDPEVGDYLEINGFGCVTCVSRRQRADGGEERRIELTIEKIALEVEGPPEAEKEGK